MSETQTVTVAYGEDAGKTATLLLAAAEKLHQDQGIVATVEGGFQVPKDVADEAGVDYDDPNEQDQDDDDSGDQGSGDADSGDGAKKTAAAKKTSAAKK